MALPSLMDENRSAPKRSRTGRAIVREGAPILEPTQSSVQHRCPGSMLWVRDSLRGIKTTPERRRKVATNLPLLRFFRRPPGLWNCAEPRPTGLALVATFLRPYRGGQICPSCFPRGRLRFTRGNISTLLATAVSPRPNRQAPEARSRTSRVLHLRSIRV